MTIQSILENIEKAKNFISNKPTREPEAMNKHGHRGVTFVKKDNRYVARIKINGIRVHLGSFKTAEEAAEAYKLALKEIS